MKTLSLFLALGLCAFCQALKLTPAPNPAPAGSIHQNWSAAANGNALLSWVEPGAKEGVYVLKYAERTVTAWSPARVIASGRPLWRHPAEAPGMVSLSD